MKKAGRPSHRFSKAEQSRGGKRNAKNPRPNDGFGKPRNPPVATNAPVAAFRAFWREWLMTPEVVAYIKKAALCWSYDEKGKPVGPCATSVALLGRLIDKVQPTPQSVKIRDDGDRPIRILLGQNGNEIEVPYLPKVPLVIPSNAAETTH